MKISAVSFLGLAAALALAGACPAQDLFAFPQGDFSNPDFVAQNADWLEHGAPATPGPTAWETAVKVGRALMYFGMAAITFVSWHRGRKARTLPGPGGAGQRAYTEEPGHSATGPYFSRN